MVDEPLVSIAVPAWRGETYIEDTLRSILAQTWTRWHALVSVDGGDEATAARCRPFAGDSRITVVVQPTRLGWAENLNWLMGRCAGDYVVYWPQDDLCAVNYIETLVAYAERHPGIACAYAEVRWFGARFERVRTPSVTGPPLDRVLSQIEGMSFLPFRGLIPQRARQGAGSLRRDVPEAALEDLVWSVQLAREGELHLVEGTLYFKRAHQDATHGAWAAWPPPARRAAWIECAMGMLAAALPVSAATDRTRLINAIVERFCVARPGRSLFFDPADEGPSGPALLAAELVAEAERRFAVIPGPGLAADFVRFARERDRTLADLALALVEGHAVPARSGDPGLAILGRGWSAPEAWGTWSSSTCAEIRLPALAGDGAWGVLLRGTPFSGGLEASGRRRIVAIAGRGVVEHEYGPGDHVMTLSIRLEASEVLAGARIELRFPDAVTPASLGLSNDTRLLGLGLMSIAVAPAVAAPASTRATASCRTSDSESRSTASRTP